MANTVINTPELLNLDSTTGATVLAKGTVNERPPVQTFSVEYLAVAGGGGGGYQDAGGGGAGGFLTNTLSSINNGQSFTLTIGEGGAGGTKNPAVVNSGDNTVIAYGSTTITAIGGGGGSSDNNVVVAASGGSGGGGAGGSGTSTGGAGTTGQGNAGGNGASNNRGGGGGGAGAAGQNATSSGANGGIGLTTTIISTTNAANASVGEVSGGNLYFAGGGGGDNRTVFGSGGLGGGTNAAANPIDAAANTGGGGGSAYNGSPVRGGAGGSGVIILKYDSSVTLTKGSGLTEASGSPFTEGSYKVSVFTQGTGNVTLSTTPDTLDAIDGTLRFNTDTNKTEYFDGANWYEIVDEYASSFEGPATNYFDTKLYTGNSSTQFVSGYINGSASFNGSNSKIELPSALSNGSTIPTGCISFWFNVGAEVTSSTPNNEIMQFAGTSSLTGKIALGSTSGHMSGETFSVTSNVVGTYTYSKTNIPAGWNHAVVQWNSSDGKWDIYINAVKHTTYTVGSQAQRYFKLKFGNRSSAYYTGSLDQIRIYNTILSGTDITALYNETAATATTAAFPSGQTAIATYTMDTSANGLLTTTDLSTVDYPAGAGCYVLYEMNGNSNDTNNTHNGTPTNITYQGGAFDQAAVFNGSNSRIDTGISSISSPFSVSMWINEDSLDSGMFFANWNSTSADMYWRTTSDGRLRISIDGFSQQYFGTAGDVTAKTWHHIAVALGSGVYEVYLDGTSLGTSTTSVTTFSSGQNFMIGNSAKPSSQYPFDGLIDQVRIFNTKLTQAQVTTLARGIATSYSGTATNVNFNGHLNFAPDLVWIKERNGTSNNQLKDTVRGNFALFSNLTLAQSPTSVLDFETNGFSFTSGDASINNSGDNYVSWNWKAGGTAVTNNDGTIASQVSANKDSGFSIVKYTGNGTAGAKIGHGLGTPPDLIIVKLLDSSKDWYVFSELLGQSGGEYQYLELNDTSAANTFNTQQVWNGVLPTSNVFTLTGGSADNLNNNEYIAYCWHSVAGYSSIGTYPGNSSTKKITLDFAPSWIMIKLIDVAGGNWFIYDNKRNPTNPADLQLEADTSAADNDHGTAYELNFLSDGFELQGAGGAVNYSGRNYLYMAIA